MKFNTIIKDAEEMVICENKYQIGKRIYTIADFIIVLHSVLYLQWGQ